MSFTYKPKKLSRRRKHGFLSRTNDRNGRKILSRRMAKNRYRLSV